MQCHHFVLVVQGTCYLLQDPRRPGRSPSGTRQRKVRFSPMRDRYELSPSRHVRLGSAGLSRRAPRVPTGTAVLVVLLTERPFLTISPASGHKGESVLNVGDTLGRNSGVTHIGLCGMAATDQRFMLCISLLLGTLFWSIYIAVFADAQLIGPLSSYENTANTQDALMVSFLTGCP